MSHLGPFTTEDSTLLTTRQSEIAAFSSPTTSTQRVQWPENETRTVLALCCKNTDATNPQIANEYLNTYLMPGATWKPDYKTVLYKVQNLRRAPAER
ncbi:hypothetical protein HK097_002159, partial [Rhizophlyctis rosea]